MDTYFASVEERERPELVGQSVIVCGSPEKHPWFRRRITLPGDMASAAPCPPSPPGGSAPGSFLPTRIDYYAEISIEIHDSGLDETDLI